MHLSEFLCNNTAIENSPIASLRLTKGHKDSKIVISITQLAGYFLTLNNWQQDVKMMLSCCWWWVYCSRQRFLDAQWQG